MKLTFDSKTKEIYIVSYLVRNRSFFLKVGKYLATNSYIKNSKFKDPKLQFIINMVNYWDQKYRKTISMQELHIQIEKMFVDDEAQQKLFKDFVKAIYELDITDVSEDFLKEEIIDFIKTDRAIEATMLNQQDIENGKYDNLSKRLQDAVNINFDKDLGVSLTNVDEIVEMLNEAEDDDGISLLGSQAMDRVIKPRGGEIFAFAGIPGAGKTLFMGTTAIEAFKQGKKVIIFSLEVNKKRLSARLYQAMFNKTKVELLNSGFADYAKSFMEGQTGDIKIVNFKANEASANDMVSVLNDIKTYEGGWTPDLIIIDYIGIMSTNSKDVKNDNSYQYCKIVTEELRNLAVEFDCPVVTACQINRQGQDANGGSKKIVTSKDLAESRGILDTVDGLGIILQTAAEKYTNPEKTEGVYRIIIDKNRNSESGGIFNFKINWKTLRVEEDFKESK